MATHQINNYVDMDVEMLMWNYYIIYYLYIIIIYGFYVNIWFVLIPVNIWKYPTAEILDWPIIKQVFQTPAVLSEAQMVCDELILKYFILFYLGFWRSLKQMSIAKANIYFIYEFLMHMPSLEKWNGF